MVIRNRHEDSPLVHQKSQVGAGERKEAGHGEGDQDTQLSGADGAMVLRVLQYGVPVGRTMFAPGHGRSPAQRAGGTAFPGSDGARLSVIKPLKVRFGTRGVGAWVAGRSKDRRIREADV